MCVWSRKLEAGEQRCMKGPGALFDGRLNMSQQCASGGTRPSGAMGCREGLFPLRCASAPAVGAVWVLQCKKDIKLTESVQRRAGLLGKDLEDKVCEECCRCEEIDHPVHRIHFLN